ncbi:MAG: metalloregulator ArsR/SmtB family transcription factor [Clostridia bacterium]|nr:metalloregulator ArsR/SmtB family transcription factor [Clostridia bacterium]
MKEFKLPHNHGDSKNAVKMHKDLSNLSRFQSAAELFKQLGDTTRLRVFWLLCHREECVINIAALLNMTSPAVSHHLRPLRELNLIESSRNGKEVYYRAADTAESKLLHEILEQVMEVSCPEKGDSEITYREIVHRIHEYLTEHLSERITIEELSKRFHINTTTLKKIFKEVYGDSVAAHIKKHRLEKAAKLLKDTEMSIFAAAKEVGYDSQSRFTAAFKQEFGVLPTEFRKRQQTKV